MKVVNTSSEKFSPTSGGFVTPCAQAWNDRVDWVDDRPEVHDERSATVTDKRHRSAVVELPTDREIVITREFDAPITRVFDVFATPARAQMALFEDETLKVCTIDLRVGGEYETVFASKDGSEASFHGTFLEVEPPIRIVATWFMDAWPDAEAVESIELHETQGVTTLRYRLAFRDLGGRDQSPMCEGIMANFDNIDDLLRSQIGPSGSVG